MAEIAKTLDQGLIILRAVSDDGPASVTELARRTGLNRTVAHRLVTTFERRGYLVRDTGGRVGLGAALVELGGRVRPDLRAAARGPMASLAHELRETVVLSVALDGEAVAVDQVSGGDHLIRVDYRPGLRHPLHRAAHGRAILAFAGGAGDAASGLDSVRRRGYATSHDELQEGAAGVAAPIFDREGRVVASLGIVAPVDRMPDEATVAAAVLAAAAETSHRLGYEPAD